MPPKMIIFLDANVEAKRLKLASSLGIAVVVEKNGNFVLVNSDVGLPLSHLFEASGSTSLEPRIVENEDVVDIALSNVGS
ncbi:hypothetical protein [Tunturiibacter gelidiferens]|uniref:hypothetical protein n=1 Tax=Tunturiibacter gelidiferens TaxID=3069689 RepID=UPI003D9B7F6D